jgi:hypothetical protein
MWFISRPKAVNPLNPGKEKFVNRRNRKAPLGKTSRAINVGIAGMLTGALGSALIRVSIYGR